MYRKPASTNADIHGLAVRGLWRWVLICIVASTATLAAWPPTRVYEGGAVKSGVGHTANARAQNCRGLEYAGSPRDGAGKMMLPGQLRENGAADWTVERTHHADENQDAINEDD